MPTQQKRTKLAYVPIAVVLFLLATLAILAEWEYDEAWTFVSVEGMAIGDIISYDPYYYANNHLVNSLWFKLLQQFSFYEPVLYRLLSLGMYLLYAIFVLKIADMRSGKKGWGMWLAIFFLLPFIPFFALGRGYSIAIACYAGGYYYYLRHEATRRSRHFLLFIFFSCISALAVFSFLYAALALYLLYIFKEIRRLKESRAGLTRYLAARAGLSLIVLGTVVYIYYAGSIINKNDVNIIGADSLGRGTLSSLLSFISLQGQLKGLAFTIARGLFVVTLLPVLFILARKRLVYDEFILVGLVCLLLFVSHGLAGSLYPMGRSAACLLLLLYIGIYRAWQQYPSVFFALHFAVVCLLGMANFVHLLRTASLPTAKEALKTVKDSGSTTLYMDMPNDNVDIYNKYVYSNTVTVKRYNKTEQFAAHIPEMEYCLLFRPASIEAVKQQNFEPVMRTQGGQLYKRK